MFLFFNVIILFEISFNLARSSWKLLACCIWQGAKQKWTSRDAASTWATGRTGSWPAAGGRCSHALDFHDVSFVNLRKKECLLRDSRDRPWLACMKWKSKCAWRTKKWRTSRPRFSWYLMISLMSMSSAFLNLAKKILQVVCWLFLARCSQLASCRRRMLSIFIRFDLSIWEWRSVC